jgi:hypothetical protein
MRITLVVRERSQPSRWGAVTIGLHERGRMQDRHLYANYARRREFAVTRMTLATLILLTLIAGFATTTSQAAEWAPPPANAKFDYQIGGDYPLPDGVSVVSRD